MEKHLGDVTLESHITFTEAQEYIEERINEIRASKKTVIEGLSVLLVGAVEYDTNILLGAVEDSVKRIYQLRLLILLLYLYFLISVPLYFYTILHYW